MPDDTTANATEQRTTDADGGDGNAPDRSSGIVSRRRFLGASAAMVTLAGCAGGDGGDGGDGGGGSTPTATPADTATPTPTQAPQTTGSAGPMEMETVRFSFVPSAATAPIWIADELGFYEERGIELNGTTSVSGSKVTAQLATGQLDLAVGAVGASTFNAMARDVPISFSADEASSTPGLPVGNRYWIRKGLYEDGMTMDDVEPPVTIATNTTASVGEYMLARTLEIHDNLSWDNVTVETMPFPQMISAMGSKSIDIAQQIDPLGGVMHKKLGAQFLEYSNRPTPELQVSGIIVGGPFRNQRREVARKWHEAYILGIRKVYEFGGYASEKVAPVVAEALGRGESSVTNSIPYLPNKNGRLYKDDIMTQQDYHACQGYVEQKVSRDQVFATELIDDALENIGAVSEDEARVGEDVFNSMEEKAPVDWPPLGDHRVPEQFPNDDICGNPLN